MLTGCITVILLMAYHSGGRWRMGEGRSHRKLMLSLTMEMLMMKFEARRNMTLAIVVLTVDPPLLYLRI